MTSELPAPGPGPDLSVIRQRADAATPGPWFVVGPPSYPSAPYITAGSPDPLHGRFIADLDCIADTTDESAPFGSNQTNDAEFIAHARTDVDLLLGEVDRLQAVNQEIRARVTAVLALHQPRRDGASSDSDGATYCSCGATELRLTDDGTSTGPVEYPCPTVRALAPLAEKSATS